MSKTGGATEGIRLVVGLGNPGVRYDNSPHNIGFEALDRLAELEGLRFRRSFRLPGRVSSWHNPRPSAWLLKPRTFMNSSGVAVAKALKRWGLAPQQVLVVYDDLELPLGRTRVRKRGGAGGHNGMRSVISELGDVEDFPRLRLGVGPRPKGEDLIDFVLSPWPPAQREQVDLLRVRAAEAIRCAVTEGVDLAMNQFNAG